MGKFEKMLVAFLFCVFLPNIIQVNANFSKSMYLTWGVQHSSIVGEDLHLVLDKTSGKYFIYLYLACISFGFNRFVPSSRMKFCTEELGNQKFIAFFNMLQMNNTEGKMMLWPNTRENTLYIHD